jgi:hypothetical protein
MSAPSRLPLDSSTHLPSINTFGDLSNFLRLAVADEDSRLLSEGMGHVAQHAEAVIASLRVDRSRAAIAPLLVDMLTVLREHRNLLLGLGLTWRGLYEYAAYLQALNNFRVLIGQWLQQVEPWDDRLRVSAEDFELVAWRTLGEGMLLIDMYEQWLQREEATPGSGLDALEQPQVERVLQWWHKLRR